MSQGIDPAMHGMVMFYSMWLYPIFDRIGYDEAMKLAQAADEICMEHPLHMTGKDMTWPMPHLGDCTGGKLIAVMSAFIVWQQRSAGVDYLPSSVLLSAADDAYRFWKLPKTGAPILKPGQQEEMFT